MSREKKNDETVGLYSHFRLKRLRRIRLKMIVNTITQIRDKISNAIQDQREFER